MGEVQLRASPGRPSPGSFVSIGLVFMGLVFPSGWSADSNQWQLNISLPRQWQSCQQCCWAEVSPALSQWLTVLPASCLCPKSQDRGLVRVYCGAKQDHREPCLGLSLTMADALGMLVVKLGTR